MNRMMRLCCEHNIKTQYTYAVVLYTAIKHCFFLIWICGAIGGANAEPGWSGSGQLPLLSGRQGPQQKLQDVAQGFLSLCVAHPKHGGKVKQDTCMNKHTNTLKQILHIKELVFYLYLAI